MSKQPNKYMKQLLTIIAAFAISLSILSCNNTSGKTDLNLQTTSGSIGTAPVIKWDSTYTAVDYAFNYLGNDYRTSTALKGIRSIYSQDPKDPTKNKLVVDSVYVIWIERDSLDVNKKPVSDSLGKVIKLFDETVLPKQLLIRDHQLRLTIPPKKKN